MNVKTLTYVADYLDGKVPGTYHSPDNLARMIREAIAEPKSAIEAVVLHNKTVKRRKARNA